MTFKAQKTEMVKISRSKRCIFLKNVLLVISFFLYFLSLSQGQVWLFMSVQTTTRCNSFINTIHVSYQLMVQHKLRQDSKCHLDPGCLFIFQGFFFFAPVTGLQHMKKNYGCLNFLITKIQIFIIYSKFIFEQYVEEYKKKSESNKNQKYKMLI